MDASVRSRSFQMMLTRWLTVIPVSLDAAFVQRKIDHTQNKKNSIDAAGGNTARLVLEWFLLHTTYMLYHILVLYFASKRGYHHREKRLFSMFVLFKQNLFITVVVYL